MTAPREFFHELTTLKGRVVGFRKGVIVADDLPGGGFQPHDIVLDYLSTLTPTANSVPYFDTSSSMALFTITSSAVGAFLTAATTDGQRHAIGLGAADSPSFTGLTVTGLTPGSLIFAGSGGLISQDNSHLFYDAVNQRTGFGLTSPTAIVHLKAGTAAAGTGPLKFTTGTNLTTPEDGAVEYDGTHFYISIGSTRFQLDRQTAANPTVVAFSDLTGQTGAVTVCTFTDTGSGGVYRCGGYVAITAVTLDVIQFQVTWTDETNTARTYTIVPVGGTTLSATGVFAFPDVQVKVKPSTAVTVQVALTTGTGSIAFDCGATIEKVR